MMDSVGYAKSSSLPKGAWLAFMLFIWALVAWLLFPLIFLDNVDILRAKEYFYRAACGIIFLIILFGKTLFDLLFPQNVSRKRTVLSVAFLTAYTFALAGGIIFMLLRILLVFLKTNSSTLGIN